MLGILNYLNIFIIKIMPTMASLELAFYSNGPYFSISFMAKFLSFIFQTIPV
jgi:hypothetical protein